MKKDRKLMIVSNIIDIETGEVLRIEVAKCDESVLYDKVNRLSNGDSLTNDEMMKGFDVSFVK